MINIAVVLFLFFYIFIMVVDCSTFYKFIKEEEWNAFKIKHDKQYTNHIEDEFRWKIYIENSMKIRKHNQLYYAGKVGYLMSENKFTDLLPHEFKERFTGFNQSLKTLSNATNFIELANVEIQIPKAIDWRTLGAVTDVKDQGLCGSCWAFSATGALEAQHFLKTNELVSLSEQNLIDCSSSYGNEGCKGGLMEHAFEYIKDNGGINTEKSYPYRGGKNVDGQCHFKREHIGATCAGFVDIPSGDEKTLKKAVGTVGPVSVAIDASKDSFQFYNSGVFFDSDCDSDKVNHGVLAVGYGTDDAGREYWIVKNSWGSGWGDEGYVKIARNKDNHCGIATQSSYPLV